MKFHAHILFSLLVNHVQITVMIPIPAFLILKSLVVEDDAEVSRLVVLEDGRKRVQVARDLADVVGVRLNQALLQEVRNLERRKKKIKARC